MPWTASGDSHTLRADRSSVTFSPCLYECAEVWSYKRHFSLCCLLLWVDEGQILLRFPNLISAQFTQIPVQVRLSAGNIDYQINRIPAGVAGQSYVLLSRSCDDFSDRNVIAGPAILEVRCQPHLEIFPSADMD